MVFVFGFSADWSVRDSWGPRESSTAGRDLTFVGVMTGEVGIKSGEAAVEVDETGTGVSVRVGVVFADGGKGMMGGEVDPVFNYKKMSYCRVKRQIPCLLGVALLLNLNISSTFSSSPTFTP